MSRYPQAPAVAHPGASALGLMLGGTLRVACWAYGLVWRQAARAAGWYWHTLPAVLPRRVVRRRTPTVRHHRGRRYAHGLARARSERIAMAATQAHLHAEERTNRDRHRRP